MFASAKRLNHKLSWRTRLVRIGERLFGHSPRQTVLPTHTSGEGEEMKLRKSRHSEDAARTSMDLDQFINAYDYSKAESRFSKASSLPPLDDRTTPFKARRKAPPSMSSRLSAHSIFSEVTGQPRHAPEPRQPIRKDLLSSRSSSTLGSSLSAWRREPERPPMPEAVSQTEAQAYASSVRPALMASPPLNPGVQWVKPTHTGGSSNNPFRQLI
ncbi:hypothetical protein H0H92_008509 [Tricholoma furcatifolium]|nr:hypothetical protein H0H92_008509 [Tricholoma furcatifolium]